MKKIKRNPYRFLFPCLALASCLLSVAANAKIYIYVGSGGDRVVTDRPLQRPGYRLQHLQQDVSDVGNILAGREEIVANKRRQFYDGYIQDASAKFNLDPALVKAVIHVESNFNPMAVSRKGARGLMQVMPKTAARYNEQDLFNPIANINVGTRHLSYLLARYAHNEKLALAAYNAGEESVDQYQGIPPFPETRLYVKRVMKYHEHYGSGVKLISQL